MGSTYETDKINTDQEIKLALQSAVLVRGVGHLIGCRSWLTARLALKEILASVKDLEKTIADGSK